MEAKLTGGSMWVDIFWGGVFGAPSWPKRAFLVVLCVGLWAYLEYIYYK